MGEAQPWTMMAGTENRNPSQSIPLAEGEETDVRLQDQLLLGYVVLGNAFTALSLLL